MLFSVQPHIPSAGLVKLNYALIINRTLEMLISPSRQNNQKCLQLKAEPCTEFLVINMLISGQPNNVP